MRQRVLSVLFLAVSVASSFGIAAAADPGFDITAMCKKTQKDKTALQNCIDEENSVKEDVYAMKIPAAIFGKCRGFVQNDVQKHTAPYTHFLICVQEAVLND